MFRRGACETPIGVNSVRKSFLSALVGIAIQDGQMDLNCTLEQLGFDELPGLREEERAASVGDLLSSRSGIYLPAPNQKTRTDYKSLRSSPNASHWLYNERPERGAYPPGQRWFYNNWDFNVAGLLYEQLTGRSIFQAFERLVAAPIQMQHFDPFVHGRYLYQRDFLGATFRAPYYQFMLSADDQAAFGELYLNNGRFNGQQVIPGNWIQQSTAPLTDTGLAGLFSHYGYMWWVESAKDPERPRAITAFGARGHFIGVLPDVQAVIVLQCVDPQAADRLTEDDYSDAVASLRQSIPTKRNL